MTALQLALVLLCTIRGHASLGTHRWWLESTESSDLTAGPTLPGSEMDALYDLYSTTGGPDWTWKNVTVEGVYSSGKPWDFDAVGENPCTDDWQGLFCGYDSTNDVYHVVDMLLIEHNLRGSLPQSIGNFSWLEVLYLGLNFLNGSLPDSLRSLTYLEQISVSYNELTGSFPEQLIDLPYLLDIYMNNNKLSGTLPESIAAFSKLQIMKMATNSFDGILPNALCQLYTLTDVVLYQNLLSGTIPSCLGNLIGLSNLELYLNRFTGTIPSELGGMQSMQLLYLANNELSGSIPDSLGTFPQVVSILLSSCRLTGSIPASFHNLHTLVQLYVDINYLTGSLAPYIGGMSDLSFLYLSNNLLDGSLPQELSQLTQISLLIIDDNFFSGSLDDAFNTTAQLLYSTIQVSDNQLTGSIPPDIFRLPQLTTFAAIKNCFDGSIPLSVCASASLSSLILDGMNSASSCQQVLLPGVSTAYVLTTTVSGGVPPCLFEMPSLTTLHLSGNSLTGSLPNSINISTKLTDLALAHNQLTGTIPHAFQRRLWYNLDLSYNKLGGTLESGWAALTASESAIDALSLRNNRLSHVIPASIHAMLNISILAGNLFTCELDGSDLPMHDSDKDTYQCGSAEFNISYYLWLSCVGAVALGGLVLFHARSRFESAMRGFFSVITMVQRWRSFLGWFDQEKTQSGQRLQHYKYVMEVSEAVSTVALWSTAFIVVLFLPLYAILSSQYSTHTYAYAYTVSAAFLSGSVSLALMLAFFLALIAALAALLRAKLRELIALQSSLRSESAVTASADAAAPSLGMTRLTKMAIYCTFFVVNFSVVVGANIAYLYVVLYENSAYNTIAQISLSVFKLLWNSTGAVYLIRWTRQRIASSAESDQQDRGAGLFLIQLFVALFNYIAVPCIVVGTVNPNCFNTVLVGSSTIHTTFGYSFCGAFYITCRKYATLYSTTSYRPPFTYSYECSSSLITYYAPSFVYVALIVTFVNPLLKAAVQWAYQHRTRGTWVACLLERNTRRIMREFDPAQGSGPRAVYRRTFDAYQLLVTVITYLGVLLTFGLVFPPIAVAMLVSIYAVIRSSEVEVGRYLTKAIDQNLPQYLDVIEGECRSVGTVQKLWHAALMVLTFTCLFYAPFLFDTLGDRVGAAKASWVVVLLALLPGALYAGVQLHSSYATRGPAAADVIDKSAMELQEIGGVGQFSVREYLPAEENKDLAVVNAMHS